MKRWLTASFADPSDLLAATHRVVGRGWHVVDALTPCPVHGLEKALGWRPSRLPWFCFLAGLTGMLLMTWFQLWTTAVDWRLNVGGRPWNSSLAFACATFEVTVLCAGLGSVLACFLRSHKYPGRREELLAEGVTDDRFALVIEEGSEPLTPAVIVGLLGDLGLVQVHEVLVERGA